MTSIVVPVGYHRAVPEARKPTTLAMSAGGYTSLNKFSLASGTFRELHADRGWTSMKSFQPKDGGGESDTSGLGHIADCNFAAKRSAIDPRWLIVAAMRRPSNSSVAGLPPPRVQKPVTPHMSGVTEANAERVLVKA